jgi:hypothetical protein
MKFRIWLENQTIEIPLVNIVVSRKALVQAFRNWKDGRESRTFGSVGVWQIDDNNYQLIDGYHRFVAAILNNNKTIKSEIIGQGHSEYMTITKPNDRFRYTPSMTYKDLEHLDIEELIDDLGL